MTVGDLGRRMSSAELSEWLAFDRIDPLPDAHWDAAMLASTTAGLWSKKRPKLEDFLPRKEIEKAKPTPRRQTPAEIKAIVDLAIGRVGRA